MLCYAMQWYTRSQFWLQYPCILVELTVRKGEGHGNLQASRHGEVVLHRLREALEFHSIVLWPLWIERGPVSRGFPWGLIALFLLFLSTSWINVSGECRVVVF